MNAWQDYYERTAAALRAALPAARVAVVDGDKAGWWLEVEQGGTVATAGTQNGPWGVTLFARNEAVARARCTDSRGTFETELDELGGTAWWYDDRKDGPDHHAAPAVVAAYIAEALGTP